VRRDRPSQTPDDTRALEQKFGRAVTAVEVRESLGLTREEYGQWVDEAQPVALVAIDRQSNFENAAGALLHDLIADDQDETACVQMEKEESTALLAKRIAEPPALPKRFCRCTISRKCPSPRWPRRLA
jgi:DNA-directed RNA polymerase specialized sigma subunit